MRTLVSTYRFHPGIGPTALLAVVLLLGLVPNSAAQTYTVDFTYDARGRLTRAVYADTSAISYTYDPAGNITSVEIGGVDVGIAGAGDLPDAFALHPPYPNPFRTATSVTFDVKEAAHVRLSIYDLLGRRVGVLVDEQRAPGRHATAFDGRGLSSGVYFCEIEMGDFRAVRQVLLVR